MSHLRWPVLIAVLCSRPATAAPSCTSAGAAAEGTKEIYAVAFVDEKTLAVAGTKPEIQLYTLDGKRTAGLPGHIEAVRTLVRDPKGHLVSGSCDESVFVWTAGQTKPTQRLVGRHLAIHEKNLDSKKWSHQACVTTLALSGDGKQLFTGANDSKVRVFGAAELEKRAELDVGDYVASIAYEHGTGTLAVGTFSGEAHLWKWRENQSRRLRVDPSRLEGWRRMAFVTVKDKTWLVTGAPDGVLRRWDPTATGDRPDATFETRGGRVGALVVHPSAPIVAAGLESGDVVLWDVARKLELTRYHAHSGMIIALAFSPDGTQLASAEFDKGPAAVWRCGLE